MKVLRRLFIIVLFFLLIFRIGGAIIMMLSIAKQEQQNLNTFNHQVQSLGTINDWNNLFLDKHSGSNEK